MDPRYTAEILKTCESIGFTSEEKYIAEPDWEVCVKDLILYLRRDDDDHNTRRLLGKAQVVGRDLLPLFKNYGNDDKVWEVGLRLLVNMTHPALLLYDEEIPRNKTYLNYYNQLEGYLRSYKEAFVDKILWKTLAEKLKHLLDLGWDKRMEQDKLTIERILILIRNVLHVPADPAKEQRADDDTSLHDRILLVMHLSGIVELLLFTASSDTTQEFSMLVLEIMSWMLREQTGEQLARTQLARNEDEKVKDERELIRMREKETILKSIQLQKLPSRHSRFGGTFVLRDVKAASGRDMLCHQPIQSISDLNLDAKKKRKKTASNRKPVVDGDNTRRSTISVRIILKEFCASFLSDNRYNRMMVLVKDNINRGRVEDNDETYYLWSLKFFMEFNRHHEFSLEHVRETMNTHTFHYVQSMLDKYQGMMVTDKEKIPFWSKRTHTALKAYQELLFTLMWMDKEEEETVQDASRAIKQNVFYLPEYRELCLGLLHTYEPVKLSKLYLKDLIETNHLFLKMLQDYSGEHRRVMIKCKGKKRKSKKESKKRKKARRGLEGTSPAPAKPVKALSSSELEDAWAASVSGEISSALLSSSRLGELPETREGEEEEKSGSARGDANNDEDGGGDGGYITNENVIPFDAASDVPIDEQKEPAVERIAAFLHTGKSKEAVMLLRAAREVWPTDPEYFGEVDVEPTDEVNLLKSIFTEKANTPLVRQARTIHRHQQQLQREREHRDSATEHRGDGEEDKDDDESRSSQPAAPLDEDERERAAVFGEENEEEENDEDEEDEEDEEEDARDTHEEQEFDFRGFLLKYAMSRVVANYALLLQDWDTLKPLTLHSIMKMFHRFVFDMEYPALICQASLFLTFKKILQVADHRSDLKEAKQFFLHFWPRFAKLCENKKMFIELLFWKTSREAQEIQDGYAELCGGGGDGKGKERKRKTKKSDWTKDEDTELELLVELYQDAPAEIKKAQKLIQYVMERWTHRPRSKRMFTNRMKLLKKNLTSDTVASSDGESEVRAPVSKPTVDTDSSSDDENERVGVSANTNVDSSDEETGKVGAVNNDSSSDEENDRVDVPANDSSSDEETEARAVVPNPAEGSSSSDDENERMAVVANDSSSDEERENVGVPAIESSSDSDTTKKLKVGVRTIESSSDSDDAENEKLSAPAIQSSSDEEIEKSSMAAGAKESNNSSDSENDEVGVVVKKKRALVIDSDDDDE